MHSQTQNEASTTHTKPFRKGHKNTQNYLIFHSKVDNEMLNYVKTTSKRKMYLIIRFVSLKSQSNYKACVFRKSTNTKETFTCKESLSYKHFSFFNHLGFAVVFFSKSDLPSKIALINKLI